MYYRLVDLCDIDVLSSAIIAKKPSLIDRMKEIITTLNDAYGERRKQSDLGGYILFFPTSDDYKNSIQTLYHFYNIDPQLYEYNEALTTEGTQCWMEQLFLLSSDYSLTFIYPKEA